MELLAEHEFDKFLIDHLKILRGHFNAMLRGSLVTTAWRVLRLRIERSVSRYGG
jgi:hypothetical protein